MGIQRPNELQQRCGEALAERVDLDWSDHHNRAQRFTDGLPNKEPASQHRSETSQPEDDSGCNASGASCFSSSLLSAEIHQSLCDEVIVTQVTAWFQQSTESLQADGAAHRQVASGELPPLIGSHVCTMTTTRVFFISSSCPRKAIGECLQPKRE